MGQRGTFGLALIVVGQHIIVATAKTLVQNVIKTRTKQGFNDMWTLVTSDCTSLRRRNVI